MAPAIRQLKLEVQLEVSIEEIPIKMRLRYTGNKNDEEHRNAVTGDTAWVLAFRYDLV